MITQPLLSWWERGKAVHNNNAQGPKIPRGGYPPPGFLQIVRFNAIMSHNNYYVKLARHKTTKTPVYPLINVK
tara:strand:+ start:408 stop:626 length:219 start_codon:yes stop_codon:yes gene_type:complete